MALKTPRLLRAVLVAFAVAAPALAVTTIGSSAALAQSDRDEGEVSIETFHRELAPYGEWFEHAQWGEVWRPNVARNWRPYTRGHWAWTDEHGWYWVAEEEWGWAAFHYGRWVLDEDEREWLWIPGTQWAPAWVQWRESDNNIGWAPLAPDSLTDSGWSRNNVSAYDSPRFSNYWVFAPLRYMFEPGLHRHVAPVSRHSYFMSDTRHIHHHHQNFRGRMYHPGIDHRRVERLVGRPLPVITLRNVSNPRDDGWRRAGRDNIVPVYRPRWNLPTPDRQRLQRPTWGGDARSGDGRAVARPNGDGFWGDRRQGIDPSRAIDPSRVRDPLRVRLPEPPVQPPVQTGGRGPQDPQLPSRRSGGIGSGQPPVVTPPPIVRIPTPAPNVAPPSRSAPPASPPPTSAGVEKRGPVVDRPPGDGRRGDGPRVGGGESKGGEGRRRNQPSDEPRKN